MIRITAFVVLHFILINIILSHPSIVSSIGELYPSSTNITVPVIHEEEGALDNIICSSKNHLMTRILCPYCHTE